MRNWRVHWKRRSVASSELNSESLSCGGYGPRRRGFFGGAIRVALVALLAGLSLSALAFEPSSALARVGGRLQPFTLPAVAGGPTRGRLNLREHVGHDPIVLLFWATWCQPCRQELPVYQQLHAQYRDQGLLVVGISMDNPNTVAQAGPWARRLGLKFPIVSDLDTSVISRLNPRRAAPFSIWVDRSGRIVREREGFSLAERDEIAAGIRELVVEPDQTREE